MKIKATVENSLHNHITIVQTNEDAKKISIGSKATGYGSSINGGELLFLALATCVCNDIYREAAKRNIQVNSVAVEVSGDFGAEGEPGSNIVYSAKVDANISAEEIARLITDTDKVLEIHNTIRKAIPV